MKSITINIPTFRDIIEKKTKERKQKNNNAYNELKDIVLHHILREPISNESKKYLVSTISDEFFYRKCKFDF